ncbi:MAG: DUF1667 domain-containing protein, partial [Coriobacteriia bacterium]|nr:DUF1667 domain-containing protein [Coriobacteriia bacterium]
KTAKPVPKGSMFSVLDAAYQLDLTVPIQAGEVLIKNVAGTGVSLIATKNLSKNPHHFRP